MGRNAILKNIGVVVKTETKIMYGDFSQQITVTLPGGETHQQWYCGKCHRIWGPTDQHMASWCCCTHMICKCGQEHSKNYTCCDDCRANKRTTAWYAKPEKDWDGSFPIALEDGDEYFFDESDLLDYLSEYEGTYQDIIDNVWLTTCRPVRPNYFDVSEWLCDDLPEGSDGPPNAKSIDERINAILGEIGIVSYMADSVRLNVKQVLDRIGYNESTHGDGSIHDES